MAERLHKGAPGNNFNYARGNRKFLTPAEGRLWKELRNCKLHGYKFRRQHPISDFIADFYCYECKLVVEVDGEYHDEIEQSQYDAGRTYELNELKVKVIRFTNREVLEETKFVLDEILTHLLNYSYETEK